jgi:hypothetical protein
MAKAKGEGVSKAQMVRDAVAALGDDGKPQDLQQWIADKFKTEISTTMISSYKSNMKKGAGKKGGRGKSGDIFNDIATIQDLLGKHGRGNLEKLIVALDK